MNKNRKVMRFECRRDSKKEKKEKKAHFVSWNLIFLLVIFSLILFSRA
jgi:predicted nucleic acid-binding Zn ribbon protein